MKVLLLNPPSTVRIHRGYYCTQIPKTSYYFQTLDLIVLSGKLSSDIKQKSIDAVSQDLSPEQLRNEIKLFSPDWIISMISEASLDEDFLTFDAIKSFCNCKIAVAGDLAKEKSVRLKHPTIDFVIEDFYHIDLMAMIESDGNSVTTIKSGYGIPHHHSFPLSSYHYPAISSHPFSMLISRYGCGNGCNYCAYSTFGAADRSLNEFEIELRYLLSIKIKAIHLVDLDFGSKVDRAKKVCALFRSLAKGIRWTTSVCINDLTYELIDEMANSGCRYILTGIESHDLDLLSKYGKKFKRDNLKQLINYSKKRGIRIVASFIIGLPEQSYQDCLDTIDYAVMLNPTFSSFNIATPLPGTLFEKKTSGNKIGIVTDTGFNYDHPSITSKQIKTITALANRRFYLRPGKLLELLFGCRSLYELRSLVSEGVPMIKHIFQ